MQPGGCTARCGSTSWRPRRWRLGCGCVPYQGNRLDGLGLRRACPPTWRDVRGGGLRSHARQHETPAASEVPGRGPDRQLHEHRTGGVGHRRGHGSHRTVERASGRSSPPRLTRTVPASPTLPSRSPRRRRRGSLSPSSSSGVPTSASASASARPLRRPAVRVAVGGVGRHRGPDDGRAGGGATLERDRDGVRAPRATVPATAPATAPHVARARAVAAAGASPHASPNAANRSDGNGNAGNGLGRTCQRLATAGNGGSRSRASRSGRRRRTRSFRPSRSAPRRPRSEARRPAPKPLIREQRFRGTPAGNRGTQLGRRPGRTPGRASRASIPIKKVRAQTP